MRLRAFAAAATRRVGRRGYSLLVLGIFDLLYALSIPGAATVRTPAALWLESVAPLDTWTVMWAVAGVILITGALTHRDRYAFATAALVKLIWAAVFTIGWVFHGVERAWVSALVWALFASWVLIISAWPEPPPDGP